MCKSKSTKEWQQSVRLVQKKPKLSRESRWQAILKSYNYKCACCGSSDRITKDHVIPTSKGGIDEPWNWQPMCFFCNQAKGSKIIDFRVGLSSYEQPEDRRLVVNEDAPNYKPWMKKQAMIDRCKVVDIGNEFWPLVLPFEFHEEMSNEDVTKWVCIFLKEYSKQRCFEFYKIWVTDDEIDAISNKCRTSDGIPVYKHTNSLITWKILHNECTFMVLYSRTRHHIVSFLPLGDE